ncbi:MAG: amino acid ABC transporter substrate-binding protein [Selenomonadaceae bacterium]|nr:amino acid ABC transporter substrate-binding protein [Selenomonadaceae bacterium]
MRKFFLPLILMLLIVTGCGGEDNSDKIISEKYGNKLVVGVDVEFPPIGFRDKQGNIVGFDVDLAKEAANRMGFEFEFKPINWDNKREEITSGNIDLIWNGCDIIDEYKEYMIFSRPYMDNRQILLVKRNNPQGIHTTSDLAGKRVGTQAGSNSESYVNETATLKNTFAMFRTYRSVNEGFAALLNDELDVLVIDEIAARYEMSRQPGKFELIEETVGPVTEFGIGFRKDDTVLRDKVQKIFDEMVADGTAKKISEQWFQADLIKRKR